MQTQLEEFLGFIKESDISNQLIKLTISKKKDDTNEINQLIIRPVELKTGKYFSFISRYKTKDITKNYSVDESLQMIQKYLENDFMQAVLQTKDELWHLTIQKSNKVKIKKQKQENSASQDLSHDKQKKRLITAEKNPYFFELGLNNAAGELKKNSFSKYKQINKYIDIIDGVLKSLEIDNINRIVDMGAGKGYLTFALYDYLRSVKKNDFEVIGVDMRKELMDHCNSIAQKIKFKGLRFIESSIINTPVENTDMVIALHACNTATDDAIVKGIQAKAEVIICAPCCHKQIRAQISNDNALNAITRHGILKERQAEIATDAMRALLLEAYGYKTNVFEFIETEHTPKNVIITAVKKKDFTDIDKDKIEELQQLKQVLGIKFHYLEKLLGV